jgi:hypothetical protein
MTLRTEVFRPEYSDVWDKFVTDSRNGTFLHSRKFFDHNPDNATDDHSLLFFKDSRLIAVLPSTFCNEILRSHPRSTYGGFVVGDSVGVKEAIEIIEATVAHAKALQAKEIIIRNPFRIFFEVPSDETDYAMWKSGFTLLSRELESAILLSRSDDLMNLLDSKARNQVRKAIKEQVRIHQTDDFASFWTILESSLASRHRTRPVHSLERINLLREKVGHDKVVLFGAFHSKKMIGGMVVFRPNSLVAHAQYIANLAEYSNLCTEGCRFLNLGTGNEDGGKTINLGLFDFKESFGGRGVLRESMHLNLEIEKK